MNSPAYPVISAGERADHARRQASGKAAGRNVTGYYGASTNHGMVANRHAWENAHAGVNPDVAPDVHGSDATRHIGREWVKRIIHNDDVIRNQAVGANVDFASGNNPAAIGVDKTVSAKGQRPAAARNNHRTVAERATIAKHNAALFVACDAGESVMQPLLASELHPVPAQPQRQQLRAGEMKKRGSFLTRRWRGFGHHVGDARVGCAHGDAALPQLHGKRKRHLRNAVLQLA